MVTAFTECVANESKKGFNPALHLNEFFSFLSYGAVWGKGAERVVPETREKRSTIDTCATVLLKPGDWPIRDDE